MTGQWYVETETAEGQREMHVFDAVMVCTGHYTQPHLPLSDFPGKMKFLIQLKSIDIFKGRYFHSWEYRSAKDLEGKRVVVVGIGNSGCDIAVDIRYNYCFPFLPPELQGKCGCRPHPLAEPTLAVVGFIHGFERNPIQADFLSYIELLAEQVGAKPNILRLFLTDPTLALQVFMGPYTSYQYRLSRPGKWAGARQAILTQKQRIFQPFRTRVVSDETENEASSSLSILMALIAGAALLWYLFHNWQFPFSPL
ncbi:hypothetical protein GOODEAATRI_023065 [Goodea atripinnis]|uniref:Flavin-containing monooxygenase n=1 Tax=Goodea atripinnis TaxID=208336 RepID=A0ABV0P755_9TELE